MKVKSETEDAQSSLTLRDPMDCSLPGSFIHGIFQARELEWVAIAFSKLHMRTCLCKIETSKARYNDKTFKIWQKKKKGNSYS